MNAPLRSMPHNVEAEQSVLGSMLIDKAAIAEAAETLEAEDFYMESHKIIFKAIKELYQKDIPVDMITLIEHLRSTEKLDEAGGISYITEISSSVPSTANLTSYIQIVEDKAILRRLIRSATEIIETSYNKQHNVDAVLDLAEKNVFNISEKKNTSDFESMSAVLERGFEE